MLEILSLGGQGVHECLRIFTENGVAMAERFRTNTVSVFRPLRSTLPNCQKQKVKITPAVSANIHVVDADTHALSTWKIINGCENIDKYPIVFV